MEILCIILATLSSFRSKMLKLRDNPISCISLTGLKENGSILSPPPSSGAGGSGRTDLGVGGALSGSCWKPSVPY